jgi:hypothetical protein
MSTVNQALQAWKQMREQVTVIAGEAILENKEQIIGLLVQQQFEEGIDSNGNPLREYSLPYRKHKELQGKSGKTDLENTGEFHATMDLTVDGEVFILKSPSTTDTGQLKSEWLNEWNEAKGGGDVMKLTEANLQLASEIVTPTFLELANERLALD